MRRRGFTVAEGLALAAMLALAALAASGVARGRAAASGDGRNAPLDAGRALLDRLKRDLRRADPWSGDGFAGTDGAFRIATVPGRLPSTWRFDAAAGRVERTDDDGTVRAFGDREAAVTGFRVAPVEFRTDVKVTRGFEIEFEVVDRSPLGSGRLRVSDLVVPPAGRRFAGVRYVE